MWRWLGALIFYVCQVDDIGREGRILLRNFGNVRERFQAGRWLARLRCLILLHERRLLEAEACILGGNDILALLVGLGFCLHFHLLKLVIL